MVQNQQGKEAYTRAGNFIVDSKGVLMTKGGELVLGNNGPITLPPFEKISLGSDGTVSIQPEGQAPNALVTIDRLRLVNPERKDLFKGEDGFIYSATGSAIADSSVRIQSGTLEGSNHNIVDGLVQMISLQQQIQQNLSMLKNIDKKAQESVKMVQVQ